MQARATRSDRVHITRTAETAATVTRQEPAHTLPRSMLADAPRAVQMAGRNMVGPSSRDLDRLARSSSPRSARGIDRKPGR